MIREEVLKGMIEVLQTVRTIDPEKLGSISEATDFKTDLQTPSSEMINIAAKVEQKFDIEFDDDDIDDLGSKVKDIIDLIIKTKEKG